jgi:hypothetical protein
MVTTDDGGRFSETWPVGDDHAGFRFAISALGLTSGAAEPFRFERIATVETDKFHYAAGEQARIIGTGFRPLEPVTLRLKFGYDAPYEPIALAADEHGRVGLRMVVGRASAEFLSVGGFGADSGLVARAITHSGITVIDDGGADDTAGQSDVNAFRFEWRRDRGLAIVMAYDDPVIVESSVYPYILIDTNGNGRVDRVVWTEIPGAASRDVDPWWSLAHSVSILSCDDTSVSACGSPQSLGDTRSVSVNGAAGGGTAVSLLVTPAELGLTEGSEPRLVNACSLGSECAVTPGSGFLTIDTVIPSSAAAATMTYALASGAAQSGASSWSVTPRPIARGVSAGTVHHIPMAPGTYVLNQLLPAGWTLTAANCRPGWDAVPTVTLPVPGPATVGLDTVIINPGELTRCKFVVEAQPATSTP